eukprot:Clim_evm16s158 gene=Clim_evmTU16s158
MADQPVNRRLFVIWVPDDDEEQDQAKTDSHTYIERLGGLQNIANAHRRTISAAGTGNVSRFPLSVDGDDAHGTHTRVVTRHEAALEYQPIVILRLLNGGSSTESPEMIGTACHTYVPRPRPHIALGADALDQSQRSVIEEALTNPSLHRHRQTLSTAFPTAVVRAQNSDEGSVFLAPGVDRLDHVLRDWATSKSERHSLLDAIGDAFHGTSSRPLHPQVAIERLAMEINQHFRRSAYQSAPTKDPPVLRPLVTPQYFSETTLAERKRRTASAASGNGSLRSLRGLGPTTTETAIKQRPALLLTEPNEHAESVGIVSLPFAARRRLRTLSPLSTGKERKLWHTDAERSLAAEIDALFLNRPIWSVPALASVMKLSPSPSSSSSASARSIDYHLLRRALAAKCTFLPDGPWAGCWCRRGHDPCQSPESRWFQTVCFRPPPHSAKSARAARQWEQSAVKKGRRSSPSSKSKKTSRPSLQSSLQELIESDPPHVFAQTARQKHSETARVFQVVDIDVASLRAWIEEQPMTARPQLNGSSDGWFERGFITALRLRMEAYVDAWRQGQAEPEGLSVTTEATRAGGVTTADDPGPQEPPTKKRRTAAREAPPKSSAVPTEEASAFLEGLVGVEGFALLDDEDDEDDDVNENEENEEDNDDDVEERPV